MNQLELTSILQNAFQEDIGMGDLTSESVFTEKQQGKGIYTSKEDGILAGLNAVKTGYKLLVPKVTVTRYKKDGDQVKKGDIIGEVEGSIRALLTGERVILNLIQHLSGIATSTRNVIDLLDDPTITVTDTYPD